MKLRKIKAVRAMAKTHTVAITFDDGSEWVKDMRRLIATRKVFAPLKGRKLFERVTIVDDGRAIQWNDDIDYCADALWIEAQEARRKLTKAAAE